MPLDAEFCAARHLHWDLNTVFRVYSALSQDYDGDSGDPFADEQVIFWVVVERFLQAHIVSFVKTFSS